ncbi:hypothetical protein L6452_01293 [Arctium lappa]|uniref:Uncharacterized protein n=1 Tax=Arctium lappa TaxID=4217 RepID=A0ACB9FH66_ARCLA|nr:hypothetical protein L6452_01293 [Arctium lappa]
MASDLTGNSLIGLDIATNRDIIRIYLANLIYLTYIITPPADRSLLLVFQTLAVPQVRRCRCRCRCRRRRRLFMHEIEMVPSPPCSFIQVLDS